MQRNLIPLLIGSILLCANTVQAATPDADAAIRRGRDLYDFGRWSDARLEFKRAETLLTPADRAERELVDYYLSACAVELGSTDAEAALRNFDTRHAGSVYANDARFSLGSYYCTVGDMKKAREAFERTNYSALSAAQRERYDIRMGYVEFADNHYAKSYDYFARIDNRSQYADHARYYQAYIDYAEERYGRAKQGFAALQQSDAYREVIPYYLLQIEFREGNYRYVVDHGDALAQRAVPERRAELERVIAESWFHLGDYNQTLTHLTAYEAAGGEMDRDANYLKGFSLYRTARYAEAAELLRKACGAEDALTQNASYHLADCSLRLNDKQAAMQAFAMASDDRFDAEIAEDALFNYAKLQYELGGGVFNGAIHVLTRYTEKYPASPRAAEARALLVAAYYNSNNYDAAYQAIKSLPSIDADMRAALQKITYFRGLEAFKSGDVKAAKQSLTESAAVNVSPKYSALASFWQGEIAFTEGDYTVAAARYNAYLKRAPRSEREYAMAWYNLGYCAFDRGDMSQTTASFNKFLAAYTPSDSYRADAYNRLGDAAYADRRFDAAVAEYEKTLKINAPEKYYAAYKRAITLGILGSTERKQQALRQIISTNQGDYVDEASYELGRSYIAQEKYAEGAKQLESFVTAYPQSAQRAQALSNLGLAYLNLGNKEKSLHYYDQVVTASPQSVEAKEAMQGIRDIYVSEGNVDAYFDYASKTGMESDLNALSRDSLSFASAQKLYLSDQREAAEKSLHNYVQNYPKGYYLTDALYYLSDCYLRGGNHEAAIQSLSTLAEQGTNQYTVTVLSKLSELTFAEKQYDKAAAAYRRLYDAAPTVSEREAAMTGYVRATIAGGDAANIISMATDVCEHADAGVTALREARYAWATQLRKTGESEQALNHYKLLSKEVRTKEGSEAAYRLIADQFAKGEYAQAEKAIFAYSERSPKPYWLAKAFLLLGDIYVQKGDAFQARATYQSIADGYSPANDGIVEEAKARIAKLNEQ